MFESGSSLDEETEFKKSLIKFVCSAINEKNKSRFLDAKGDCESLINKMLNENYINKNSVDLIS